MNRVRRFVASRKFGLWHSVGFLLLHVFALWHTLVTPKVGKGWAVFLGLTLPWSFEEVRKVLRREVEK